MPQASPPWAPENEYLLSHRGFEERLRATPLFRHKPVAMPFETWRSIVTVGYVGICGDLFHAGHLNILQTAKVHCQIVVVGVLADPAMTAYKRAPLIPFVERCRIVENLGCVDIVVAQETHSYRSNLLAVRPRYLFHGDDWRHGPQAGIRREAIETLAAFGGELIEPARYPGVSTTELIERAQVTAALPEP